jgi:hypothetical protein
MGIIESRAALVAKVAAEQRRGRPARRRRRPGHPPATRHGGHGGLHPRPAAAARTLPPARWPRGTADLLRLLSRVDSLLSLDSASSVLS